MNRMWDPWFPMVKNDTLLNWANFVIDDTINILFLDTSEMWSWTYGKYYRKLFPGTFFGITPWICIPEWFEMLAGQPNFIWRLMTLDSISRIVMTTTEQVPFL